MEYIDTGIFVLLMSTIGIMLRAKLNKVCKGLKEVTDKLTGFEKMRNGIEKHCPIYKHDVKGES